MGYPHLPLGSRPHPASRRRAARSAQPSGHGGPRRMIHPARRGRGSTRRCYGAAQGRFSGSSDHPAYPTRPLAHSKDNHLPSASADSLSQNRKEGNVSRVVGIDQSAEARTRARNPTNDWSHSARVVLRSRLPGAGIEEPVGGVKSACGLPGPSLGNIHTWRGQSTPAVPPPPCPTAKVMASRTPSRR